MSEEAKKESGIGSFANVLNGADGGLLALNLGALTFVAGFVKFGDLGDKDLVNIPILAGGLCVALFFAILLAYTTVFGMRATAGSWAGKEHQPPFDTMLSIDFGGSSPWRWLTKFLLVVTLLVGPAVWIGAKFGSMNASLDTSLMAVVSASEKYDTDKCSAQKQNGGAAGQGTDGAKAGNDTGTGSTKQSVANAAAAAAKSEEGCDRDRKSFSDAKSKFDNLKEDTDSKKEKQVVPLIIFYSLVPLIVWGGAYARAKFRRTTDNPSVDDSSPGNTSTPTREPLTPLQVQIKYLQLVRVATAFVSLNAFMIGVGTALVDAGVANLRVGVATTATPAASSSITTVAYTVEGKPITIVFQHSGVPASVKPPQDNPPPSDPGAKPAAINVVLPENFHITLTQDPATSGENVTPQPTIDLKGFDKLLAQSLSIQEKLLTQKPQIITFKGLDGQNGAPGALLVQRCKTTVFNLLTGNCYYEEITPGEAAKLLAMPHPDKIAADQQGAPAGTH